MTPSVIKRHLFPSAASRPPLRRSSITSISSATSGAAHKYEQNNSTAILKLPTEMSGIHLSDGTVTETQPPGRTLTAGVQTAGCCATAARQRPDLGLRFMVAITRALFGIINLRLHSIYSRFNGVHYQGKGSPSNARNRPESAASRPSCRAAAHTARAFCTLCSPGTARVISISPACGSATRKRLPALP